jgi:lipopolysaccharide export system protein LptC
VERRNVIALAALLCAAVASGILLVRSRDVREPPERAPALGIGYYAENATLSGTGDNGNLIYQVSAASIVQAPSDGSISLREVTVRYSPANDIPWSLTADTGRIPPGDKMIELSGNVVAETRETGSPAATIRTDYLEFDPVTSVAATDRRVVIEYDGSTLQATGMRAILRDERLELLSGVSGRYVR